MGSEGLGFGVVLDGFGVGVPVEFFAAEAKGDVSEVGDGDGAMGGLDGGGRLGAVLDGVDEVAKVVFAFVEVDFV